jgi:hypothetical protein
VLIELPDEINSRCMLIQRVAAAIAIGAAALSLITGRTDEKTVRVRVVDNDPPISHQTGAESFTFPAQMIVLTPMTMET